MKLEGALLINKPGGMTSHDVVAIVRKLYDTRAVGHAGTLDPIATGLLICLLGEATKLSNYVMSENKTYRVGIKFGVKTDSGDVSGKVISEDTPDITESNLLEKIKSLVGEIQLTVPKYSAIKVAGKKLYEYARENEDVELPIKTMVIHEAKLEALSTSTAQVVLDCEKGTYVRSWVEKLGELMGCGATVETLCRVKSGPFDLSQASNLDALEALSLEGRMSKLIPVSDVLSGWPALRVEGQSLTLIKNGQIPKPIFSQVLASSVTSSGVRLVDANGNLVALLLKDPQKGLKIARVFNAIEPV